MAPKTQTTAATEESLAARALAMGPDDGFTVPGGKDLPRRKDAPTGAKIPFKRPKRRSA